MRLCDDRAVVGGVSAKPMLQAKPRWSWTGVAELVFSGRDSRLHDLVTLLPARRSTIEQAVAYLVHLGAHFQKWLHQDEFGPSRGQQTAALRALMKSLWSLQKQLLKGSSFLNGRSNDPSRPVMQALYEAAADIQSDLRTAEAPNRDLIWVSKLRDCIETLIAQSQSLDTNTDGAISVTAWQRKFDLSQMAGLDFGLADVESWLNGYWDVLARTLNKFNSRGGAGERVSLKLLVEQLCEFWERETDSQVTAHGQVKDVYTGQAETIAGRFVTAAVEAMLPDHSWFEEHAEFGHSVRAETFRASRQQDRARQILVINERFCEAAAENLAKARLHIKLAFNSIKAAKHYFL